MAARNNRFVLEFAAQIDSSVKATLNQFGGIVQKLNAQIANLSDEIREMTNENNQAVVATRKMQVAARDFTSSVVKQTTAIAKGKAVSQDYLNVQHSIALQYGQNNAAAGTALRALEKTERQYRRNAAAINAQKLALQQLLAQQKELALDYRTSPTTETKLSAYDALQANKARIAAARATLQSTTDSINASFNYGRVYADNLKKIEKSLVDLTGAARMFGKEQAWVARIAEQITARTGEGTLEQRRQFNLLRQYVREVGVEYQRFETRIADAERALTASTARERANIQRLIDSLRAKQQELITGAGMKGTHGFDQWAAGVNKVEAQFNGLKTVFSTIRHEATKTAESVRQGIMSVVDAQQRLKRINMVNTGASSIQGRYSLGTSQVDSIIQATRILEQISSGRVNTQREVNQVLAEEAKKLQAIVPLHQRIAAEIGNTVKVLTQYAVSGTVIYGVASAFRAGAAAIVEYDQAMKDLQAITSASDTELMALGDEIRRVAVETRYGMREVADGAKVIGQAGFDASQTIEVLGSTMELAQGTMSGVEATADLLTTTLMSFRKSAEETAEVADVMAAAINRSKLDIEKLRTVFNYVGPVAMDAGLSLNEVTAALMLLANNGMKASTIGTSLRNVFSQLSSPSAKLRASFKGNEQALAKLMDKATPLAKRFEILNKQLGTSADLYQLFGLRAAGSVSILKDMYPELQRLQDSLYVMGTASMMADKQMEGLGNRLANLRAAMEVFIVTSTTTVAGIFSDLVLYLQKAVTFLSEFAGGSVGNAVTTVGALAAAILSLVTVVKVLGVWLTWLGGAAVLGGVQKAIGAAAVATTVLSGSFATGTASATLFGTALKGVGIALSFLAAHPIVAVLTGVGIAVAAATVGIHAFSDATAEADNTTQKFIRSLNQKREILSRGLTANDNIQNETYRRQNTMVIARDVPEIADELMAALGNRERTSQILRGYLKDVQQDTVTEIDKFTNQLLSRISESREKLQRLTVVDNAQESGFLSSIFGVTPEERQQEAADLLSDIEKDEQRIRTLHNSLVQFARDAASSDITQGLSGNYLSAFEFHLQRLTSNMDPAITKLNELAIAIESAQHSMGNVDATTKTLDDFLQNEHIHTLEEQAAAYGQLADQVMPRLRRINYEMMTDLMKARKEYGEGTEERANAEAAAMEKMANQKKTLIKDWLRTRRDILQIDANQRKSEIEAEYAAGTLSAEEAAKKRAAIDEQAATATMSAISEVIRYLLVLNNIQLDKKTLDFAINGIIDEKTLAILAGLMDEGSFQALLSLLSGYNQASNELLKAQTTANRPPNDRSGRDRLAALKARLATEQALNEKAYQLGELSYEQYTDARITSERRLLAERTAVANSMKGAERERAMQEIARDRAAFELKLIKEQQTAKLDALNRELEYKRNVGAETIELLRQQGITEEEYTLRQAQLDEEVAQQAIVNIQTRMTMQRNEQEQEQDANDLVAAKTDLLKKQRATQEALYDVISKNIEREYKFGNVPTEAYMRVVRLGVQLGKIDPLEGLDKIQMVEGPLSAMVVGFRRAKMSVKDMNSEMSDFAESIGRRFNTLTDNFVDAWADGTKTTKELLRDFISDISRDFQKSFMRGLVNQILYGSSGGAGGATGAGGGLFGFLTGGYGLGGQPNTSPTVGMHGMSATGGLSQSVDTTSDATGKKITSDTTKMQHSTTDAMSNVTSNADAVAMTVQQAATTTQLSSQQMVSTIGSAALGIMGIASGTKEGLISGIMMFTMSALQIFSTMAAMSAASSSSSGLSGILSAATVAVTAAAANGAVFSGGTISDYSNSIVKKPTTFLFNQQFAKGGVGLMGEVPGKAEAILPLTQSSNGRYGVDAHGVGSGAQNITINIMDSDGNTEESFDVHNNQGQRDFVATFKKSVQRDIATPGTGIYRELHRQGLRMPVMKNGG